MENKRKLFLFVCLFASTLLYGQVVGIKTNVLMDITKTINLGAEIGLSKKSTLDLYANYNPWEDSNNKMFKMLAFQPEYRYWFCDRFNGHFIGIHAHGGIYQVAGIDMPWGIWKGLKDLYAIGFIDRLPRLISAQAEGCCPINRAIAENKPWEPMEENTLADSIAVGVPRNADKALMAIRESDGIVVNVSDEEIMAAQKLLGRTCGVFGEPAGVTGAAGVKKLCEQGVIGKDDTVVSVVTGNGLKDVANAIKAAGEPISIPSDMDRLLAAFAEKGITVE
mgnify:FL=1